MAMKKLFSEWDCEALEETFALRRVHNHAVLNVWLAKAEPLHIDDVDRVILQRFQEILLDNTDAWNEVELCEYFIGPVLTLVNFNTDYFKLFSERTMTAQVGEYELSGEPDGIIATGHYSPKIPYFCFHEYKKEHEPKGDPAAQALSAMLAAQSLNSRPHPIYGLYVVGKMWYFMILDDHEYSITVGHNALKNELFEIFTILKALKHLLLEIAREDINSIKA